MLAKAIETEIPWLGVTVFGDGLRLIVSTKDKSDVLVDIRLNNDKDLDEIVYWFTESVLNTRQGLPLKTMHETIASSVEWSVKNDVGVFARNHLEPRIVSCLPGKIADRYRRNIIYRLMLRGYRGPRLEFALADALQDDIQESVIDNDIKEITKEIIRTIAMDDGVKSHLLEQRISEIVTDLWNRGEQKLAVHALKILVDFHKSIGPNKKDDKPDRWSVMSDETLKKHVDERVKTYIGTEGKNTGLH